MSILNPLADLVAWVIMHIHAGLGALFGPNTGLAWGLSIAGLVIIIRLLLVPLFVKQVNAQRKMAQHAPQIAELRKKYKNDKQRLNEETMKFYKENGVNPLAGCLPMIPQMIVFFSLFYVLRAIADWHPGVKPAYGLTVPVMESAQKATILGVHLGDRLLFSHQAVPLHVAIVIVLTVIVSASTTFMTVRQSSKRGLMQTNVDPDNPLAASQKYMMYIVPFFSLTGLYWQYGLVLYWVTTNLWTLGQQYFMFRNWTVEPTQAAGATAAAGGSPVRATQSSLRPTSGARAGTARAGTAKTATGTAKTSTGTTRTGSGTTRTGSGPAKTASGETKTDFDPRTPKTATGSARTGSGNGRPGAAAPRPKAASGSTSTGSGTVRTGSARGDAAAAAANGQNGAARRGLLRLGRQKPEPEPEPEVPAAKVVRQQPVRQAKSKRSGKR
ncbi:MAG TPA: membrane protein insertase YidC [Streptosporangiaceae bacterium]|nr:membrane protein insertase YidC [Streptosporangiaceae bacterium]